MGIISYLFAQQSLDGFLLYSCSGFLPVEEILDFVDADEPMLRGVGLFQVLQVKVLVPDLHVTRAVKAGRCAEVKLQE